MKRKIKYYRLVWLKYDLPAGLTVFLVALPLCLGIALASGAPLYSGILSGVIGGMVVSFISGSQLNVSGPAAGLSTVIAASSVSLGNYNILLLAIIIAGLFQILLGLLRLGSISNYFPSAVIKGMLAAIGIILISKQIPIALGYDQPDFWTSGFLNLFSPDNFFGNIHNLNLHTSRGTILISFISLVLLIIFKQPFLKKYHMIPAPLLVVVGGILINMILSYFTEDLSLKKTQLVAIPENIFESIIFPDFSKFFSDVKIIETGLVIGILASLESLLCTEAIDKLDIHNRVTPVNRELIAQGIGNTICGFFGGIPITAVIVRGAANVDAGARTKLSSFTHGLFLLIAVLLIPFILNKIPYSSLAIILLITGYNLTKPKLYRNMWKLGWKQFLPFLITIIIILSTDLLIGVSIGLLISVFFIIQNNFRADYKIKTMTKDGIGIFYIKLNSNVTFLNKVRIREALDKISEDSILTIDGSECNFIDYDVLEIISEFEAKANERNIELHLNGIEKVNVTAIH